MPSYNQAPRLLTQNNRVAILWNGSRRTLRGITNIKLNVNHLKKLKQLRACRDEKNIREIRIEQVVSPHYKGVLTDWIFCNGKVRHKRLPKRSICPSSFGTDYDRFIKNKTTIKSCFDKYVRLGLFHNSEYMLWGKHVFNHIFSRDNYILDYDVPVINTMLNPTVGSLIDATATNTKTGAVEVIEIKTTLRNPRPTLDEIKRFFNYEKEICLERVVRLLSQTRYNRNTFLKGLFQTLCYHVMLQKTNRSQSISPICHMFVFHPVHQSVTHVRFNVTTSCANQVIQLLWGAETRKDNIKHVKQEEDQTRTRRRRFCHEAVVPNIYIPQTTCVDLVSNDTICAFDIEKFKRDFNIGAKEELKRMQSFIDAKTKSLGLKKNQVGVCVCVLNTNGKRYGHLKVLDNAKRLLQQTDWLRKRTQNRIIQTLKKHFDPNLQLFFLVHPLHRRMTVVYV